MRNNDSFQGFRVPRPENERLLSLLAPFGLGWWEREARIRDKASECATLGAIHRRIEAGSDRGASP
jgi:hypothetical protein